MKPIFIYGQDTYRSRQKLTETISYFKARKERILLQEIDLSGTTLSNPLEGFSQNALFGQPKAVIIRNAFATASSLERLKVILEKEGGIQNTSIILYEESEPKEADEFFKFLLKNADSYHYPILTGKSLIAWIEGEVKKTGGNIEKEAISYLADWMESDTWALSSEIKKLIAFKRGKTITLKDVAVFGSRAADTVIFQTLDAISDGRKPEALKYLADHLAKGESPFYILTMLFYQLKNLMLAKEVAEGRSTLKESGLHPYVFKKLRVFSRRFSALDLKRALRRAFDVDRDIKIGRVGPEIALELLVADM